MEKGLLGQIAAGSVEAFTQLYRMYSRRIYEVGMLYLQDAESASDLVQETFIRLWEKRARLTEVRQPDDFLFIVARNIMLSQFRRSALVRAAKRHFQRQGTQAVRDCENRVLESENQRLLQRAIAALPPRRREIFLLSRQEGLSYQEIAQRMHVSRFTVKNQMGQAIQSLRHFFHNHVATLIALVWLMGWA